MFPSAYTTRARRTLTAALLTALVALGTGAGAADAKAPRAFYGVEGDPVSSTATSQADFNRLRSARVGTLRVSFHWASVEPTQGAPRDWTYYDTLVERAARARVGILAVLVGSPPFAAGSAAYAPLTAAGRASFKRFVRDVVRRYGRGGRFWRSHPRVPRRPIPAYQVWNEPNYPPHWASGPAQARDVGDYASLLKLAGSTIRANDRRAKIGTGGLLASSTRGLAGYRYLDALYRVKGIKRYFDAVAIHPYSENAAGVKGELTRIRQVMRRHGDSRTPVWLSELGWATGGGNPYFSTTPAGQAERLRSAFRFVTRNRKRYRVGKLVWFSWRDRAGPSQRGWEFYCGLFSLDGQAKPAWAAFRRFTRATG